MLPQEFRFGNTLRTCFHFTGVHQFTLNGPFALGQLFQQRWRDGQAVTASQFENFTNVTEAGAHHYGFITVLLVVLVDFADGNHARIFCRRVLFLIGVGFVPVEDTTNERRNQEDARFGASTSLSEGEQQGQVAVDAFFFQLLSGANALPGGSQLDQNTIVADARVVIQLDDALSFGDRRFGVVGETCIHFGGDTARDQFQDFETNVHRQLIGSIKDLLRAIAALATSPGHSVINQLTVLRDLSRAEDQGRVGGGILRLIQLHCRNISGVSDDSGVLTQRS